MLNTEQKLHARWGYLPAAPEFLKPASKPRRPPRSFYVKGSVAYYFLLVLSEHILHGLPSSAIYDRAIILGCTHKRSTVLQSAQTLKYKAWIEKITNEPKPHWRLTALGAEKAYWIIEMNRQEVAC